MAVVRIEVCDVCRDVGRIGAKYRVGDTDGIRPVTLCKEHLGASSLGELLTLTARNRRPRVKFQATTMEEVEAAKKPAPVARKRATRKRA